MVSCLGNRTFRYFASSPPGRFATGRQSSYSIANYKLSDSWRNACREVAKRPGGKLANVHEPAASTL